jgi:CelD/BcsL family acetyltransferase involved in cellulose biosynthesis
MEGKRMEFEILTSASAVEKLAAEWQVLHEKVGHVFGGYGWFEAWWRNLGQNSKVRLHVAVARDTGRLAAVLPLVVRRQGMLRVLEWAGYEVFDYGDVLTEGAQNAEALWLFVLEQGGYDFALLKDVHEGALSLPVVGATMRLRQQRRNYFLTLAFSSGEAWLAAQSRKLRGDTRRKAEKLQAHGATAFNFYRSGDLIPTHVIDALYAQKLAWFHDRQADGVFAKPEVKAFLNDMARNAAKQGSLYLAWLTSGDTIVACHMGFVQNGVLHLYHTTYDAEYGTYSPGNIMMIETIKWAVDSQLRELDFMRGDEAYKQRFATGSRALSAFIVGRTGMGKIALWLYALRQKASAVEPQTATPNTDV